MSNRHVVCTGARGATNTFAQRGLVRDTLGMVALLPAIDFPLEVWLTTHRELFTSRRIRAIYDALADALAAYIGDL